MNRRDVIAARDLAQRFVEVSDELLAEQSRSYDADKSEWVAADWRGTWQVAGKLSGHHRRLSLELTRALARMRNG